MRALRIVVTDRCNLNCSYCYNEGNKKPYSRYNELKIDNIERILVDLKSEISEVVITGGEPLLYSKLGYLIDILNKTGYKFRITTNGILLDNLFKLKQYVYVKTVNVSIDRFNEKEFRIGTSTRSKDYNNILCNITKLVNDGIDVSLNIIVSNDSIEQDFEDIFESAQKLGVTCIKFLPKIGDNENIITKKIKRYLKERFGEEIDYLNNDLEIEKYRCSNTYVYILHQYCNGISCDICKKTSFYRLNFDGKLKTCLQNKGPDLDLNNIINDGKNILQSYREVDQLNMSILGQLDQNMSNV